MGKKKKAERKRAELEAREAAIVAALREKKKAEKPKGKKPKKGKKAKPAPIANDHTIADAGAALGTMTIGVDGVTPDPEPEPVDDVAERAKPLAAEDVKAAVTADTDAAIKKRVQQKREARERDERLKDLQKNVAAERAERVEKAKADTESAPPAPPAQEAEIVETDHGREIAVGAAKAEPEEFGKPSEAPKTLEDNVNGLGQYKIQRPGDGKEIGYTRMTTYIAALEDTTKLTEWKLRVLLEGVAAADEGAALDETRASTSPLVTIRDLIHRRDVEIAKAERKDRKGKLATGQLATLRDAAWGDFKRGMNALADDLFELGGGREKAQKGTDLHALCDLYDREGIAAVGDLLTAGEITPSDLADVEAYAAAMKAIGAEIVSIERVVVDDERKVAGRLDRTVKIALPEIRDPKSGEILRPAERNRRHRVLDLKTGRVDYSIPKIAQQIAGYAGCVGYDVNTGEREPLKLDTTTGILVHLPAGSAKATVHIVDLALGKKGNRIVADVRSFRNEGKRAIDLKVDVVEHAEAAS